MSAGPTLIEFRGQFKGSVFRIVTANSKAPTAPFPLSPTDVLHEFTVIAVPPQFLGELKKLPDDVVSLNDAIAQTLHAKYTKLIVGETLVAHTIKTSLTPALARLNPAIADEVQESISRELPPCHEWTLVNINHKLLRIVALVSGRVFIGPELSRNEEYLDAAISYTIELMQASRALDQMRPWMRPFLGSRLPEVRKIDRRLVQADKFLRPIVAARRQLEGPEKPDDMLQWLMDGGQDNTKFKQLSTEKLARLQLIISFAAIHTTTLTSTNV